MSTSTVRSPSGRERGAATTGAEASPAAAKPPAGEVKGPVPLERAEDEVRTRRLIRLLQGAISMVALAAAMGA